jgi:hypothetical protein
LPMQRIAEPRKRQHVDCGEKSSITPNQLRAIERR